MAPCSDWAPWTDYGARCRQISQRMSAKTVDIDMRSMTANGNDAPVVERPVWGAKLLAAPALKGDILGTEITS